MELTYKEYMTEIGKMTKDVNLSHLRLGQLHFNLLNQLRPDLAKRVFGQPKIDPYYDNKNIVDYLNFVRQNW